MRRIPILDGWRALSIILVMAGHLLPIGPPSWQLNGAVAASGMAIFFTLSGFLITQFLLEKPDIPSFLMRRIFRIVPLAWVAVLALAVATHADAANLGYNLLFVANLPPTHLMYGGEHLWSLCVEVQFYVSIALLVAVAGRRALYLLPLLCVGVTVLRMFQGAQISIFTWQRIDEILAGATISLVYHALKERPPKLHASLPLLFFPILVAAGHPMFGPLNYLRPYLASAAIGCSLFAAPVVVRRVFESRAAHYIAEISYALYVFHAMFASTWLGEGSQIVKYAKRPFLLAVTVASAHLSTFYFERPMQTLGRRIERWGSSRSAARQERRATDPS